MTRKVLHSDDAPKAIGPYSQAVQVEGGRMTFLSGQIPLDPKTMELVGGDDVVAQTEQVMKNLQAVLAAGGLTFANVVRCGIFLQDMADFARVNEVYARYFKDAPPARATVQAAGLPRGVKVEIDAIAVG